MLTMISAAFLLLWGLFDRFSSKEKNIISESEYFSEERKEVEISEEPESPVGKIDSSAEFEEEKAARDSEEIAKEDEDNEKEKERASDSDIKNRLVSWGFSVSSERSIDTIILHSSYNALGGDEYDVEKLIDEYKEYGVSPHYLIDREGIIYRLVEDKNIAYHAGESETPDGRNNVNNFSLGIEMINNKSDEYEKKQYEAVNRLIGYINRNYDIKYVLGHSEIASGRKTDPWNIDWKKIER
ncbi:MAG: N-acetylmuramoyl-L-alanine amidase [Parcubacteria group bacterium]